MQPPRLPFNATAFPFVAAGATPFIANPAALLPQLRSHRSSAVARRRPRTMRCDYCEIEVNSEAVWRTHVTGLKHLKKVRMAKAAAKAVLSEPVDDEKPTDEEKKKAPKAPPVVEALRRSPSPRNWRSTSAAVAAAEAHFEAIVTSRNRPSQKLTHRANVLKINTLFELVDHIDDDEEPLFHVRLKIGDEFYDGKAMSIKEAHDEAAEKALEECDALKQYSEDRYKASMLRRVRENELRAQQESYNRFRDFNRPNGPTRRRRSPSPSVSEVPPPSFLQQSKQGDNQDRIGPEQRYQRSKIEGNRLDPYARRSPRREHRKDRVDERRH
ncbi:hypothetical protein ACOME3_006856 [Neoechinorhynchus agilis]